MDNRNKQQKPKKKGSGLWAFVILALIAFFNMADFDELSYRISRFFRTGRLSPDSAVFVIAAAVILAIVLLLVTLARAKKVREAKRFDGIRSFGGGTAKAHSHDQVTGYKLGAESGEEHWKKQLDGFLAAGIIDRSEYRTLLERRRR